eukprot:SAG22_NODE_89_length_21278_cov_16.698758_9_plen_638_part_00
MHFTRLSRETDLRLTVFAGNFMSTSLMGSCAEDLHGCPLGSLTYRSDFDPTATGCFGPGGQYQMLRTESMWIFLSHNAGDDPLDFFVLGNLGSDGSGEVTEFVLEAPPFVGFVKRECADGGGDPSVNHVIVVDGSGGLPTHTCDYQSGGECAGASSDLDDDILQGIAPGSPILYLLFSSEDGYCVKEDEHRMIFDAAVRCLWADDPFAAVRADRGQVGDQPLVSVEVDERGEIVFGGTAAYIGWGRGGGPSVGADGALRFEPGQWLQLGDGQDGCVSFPGNWMVNVFVRTSVEELRSFQGAGALLADAMASAALVGLADAHIRESLMAVEDGWHRLTVTADVTSAASGPTITDTGSACTGTGSQLIVNDTAGTIALTDGYEDNMQCDWLVCQPGSSSVSLKLVELSTEANLDFLQLYEGAGAGTDSPASKMSGDLGSQQTEYSLAGPVRVRFTSDWSVSSAGFRLEFACAENRTVFIDGMPVRSERLDWDGSSCVSEIGRGFPLAVRGLQVFDSITAIPSTTALETASFAPLPYHAENSRWVQISRGLDGVEIRWDTIGWERATHEQVTVSLDPAGGITAVTTRNTSLLWDRATASTGGVASDPAAAANWTSATRNTTGALGLHVGYVDSDPCFDLW